MDQQQTVLSKAVLSKAVSSMAVPSRTVPSKARNQVVGARGEEIAAQHLTGLGWEILDRNWRGTRGELDIVALDGDEVVVVEVKTRTTSAFGHPALAVDAAKLARLGRLAGQWLGEHRVHSISVRIDVVAVLVPNEGVPTLDHLRGVQP